MKKIHTFAIVSFGCRVNQAESRKIGEELCSLGWKNLGNQGSLADLVVINSCAVTAKAEKEVRQTIRRVKRENPNCFLVAAGCWVEKVQRAKGKGQNYPSKANTFSRAGNLNLKTNENIDLFIENKDKERVGEIIKKKFNNETTRLPAPKAQAGNGQVKQFSNKTVYKDKYFNSQKALVKIQEGCNNFCSYCIVPYLRGKPKSVPVEKIVKDISWLVDKGIKEIILTGTEVSSFQLKAKSSKLKAKISRLNKYKNHLVKLLLLILSETKVKKISFGSMNLEVFDEEFVNFLEARSQTPDTRISTHFHIPLQSGCDATLKRMNRKYTVKDFRSRIDILRKKIPGFTFSTDIIIGFPGETEEEFQESLKSLRDLKALMGKRFTKVHIFRFSPRKGTLAEKMQGKKDWEEVNGIKKRQRFVQIRRLMDN